jgi:hypothetical protein
MFELKRLSTAAIPGALAKAERYRLLNEPEEAQSICEDVLGADPDNFEAVRVLILALTDTFPESGTKRGEPGPGAGRAAAVGIRARLLRRPRRRASRPRVTHARRPRPRLAGGRSLREAMRSFERADAVKPADNEDALLRWNACARLFHRHPELAVIDEERTAPVMLE